VKDDSKYVPCIIDGLLSDDEKVARSAYQALHNICAKRNISSKEDRFQNPIKFENFNSVYVRGGEYNCWSEWWSKAQNHTAVRLWAEAPHAGSREADGADWDDMMSCLRPGSGFHDPGRAEGIVFQKIRRMGTAAYPYLVHYIDHEDLAVGKAAVLVLNALTGQQRPLLNASNRTQLKAEWESWLKKAGIERRAASLEVVRMMVSGRTEAEVRLLLDHLASEDFKTRSRAQEDLEKCALPHADLIRKTFDQAKDAEVRYRLDPIVRNLPRWQAEEARIRSKPDLLLDILKYLPEGTPEELRRRIEKLHRELKK